MSRKQASKAFGRSYLVFDRDGNEYATIRGRLLYQAIADADKCGGEVWLDGRCVIPAYDEPFASQP